jgi:hypothetical protein
MDHPPAVTPETAFFWDTQAGQDRPRSASVETSGRHHPSVAVVHQDLARPVLTRDLRDVPEGFVDPCVAVEHRATAATHPPVLGLDDPEEQPARLHPHLAL